MRQIPSTADDSVIQTLQRRSLLTGGIALLFCLVGALLNEAQFFQSYLLGFLFWTSIALGCLGIVMLHHLTGGAWGVVIRRLLESGSITIVLMALLFVPLAMGIPQVYSWAREAELPRERLEYLNPVFFVVRAVVYFLLWVTGALLLNRWSEQQDQAAGAAKPLRRLRLLSGPGLVLLGLTATFASVDWIMSLEAHWYSSLFGLLIISGQALSALAFAIVIIVLLGRHSDFAAALQARHLHDLGKLLLAFVMLWAYLSFSQLLIIWSGNLQEEIPWYVRRWSGGWQWLGIGLVVFHFALPFFLLLSRDVKRKAGTLAMVAGFLLVMRLADLFWLIAPQFSDGGFRFHWMDAAVPVAIGGFWLAAFAWQLQRRPLLPLGDPRLGQVLEIRSE